MSNNYERFENEAELPPPYTSAASAPPHPGQQPPPTQKGYPQQGYPRQGYPPPPQHGYPAPPQGQHNYPAPPPQNFGPNNMQYPTGAVPPTVGNTQVVVNLAGNCPNCRIGNMQESFNICGIILAVLFFPIGLLFLLCMIDKKCSHCGFVAA